MIIIRMIRLDFWRTAAKLAWRNLKRSRNSSAFLLVAIAVSISGISGVDGAARIARQALVRDARVWLAADIAADTGDALDSQTLDALDHVPGIQWTVVRWTMTMAASPASPDPGFIALKAVDPARYPFYGEIGLSPSQPLAHALEADGAAVSQDVFSRFNLRLGDRILLGGAPFRITARIQSEPERYNGFFGGGMRAIVSENGLDRSGIARSGNEVKYRVLIRLPNGADLSASKRWLQNLFPQAAILDYNDANRQGVARIERILDFLNVTAFLALTLGWIGIAAVMRQHIEQSMSMLLVMKLLGGRTPQIAGVFLIETAWLILGGITLGIPAGLLVRSVVLSFSGAFIPLSTTAWSFADLVDSVMAAMIASIPAVLLVFLAIRSLRPALLLRRHTGEPANVWPREKASGALVGVTLALLAFRLLGSWRSALILAGGFGTALGVSAAVTFAATASLERASRWPSLRRALAGFGTRGLLLSLSIVVMIMTSTFIVETSLVQAIVRAMPLDQTGLLITGFEDSQRERVRSFVAGQTGVEAIDIVTQARLRLATVNGVPITRNTYVVGCATSLPSIAHAVAAELSPEAEREIGARIGSRLTFESRGATTSAIVSSVRPMKPVEQYWHNVSLDCTNLDEGELFHHAEVRIAPNRVEAVRRTVSEAFPTLAVISVDDLRAMIHGASGDAIALARALAWYAIGMGAAVLIATGAASRALRRAEIGVLAALGARPATVVRFHTLEFAAIGALAGLMGGMLSFGFASLILSAIFRAELVTLRLDVLTADTLLASAFTIAAGWLPLWSALRRPPLEILRGE